MRPPLPRGLYLPCCPWGSGRRAGVRERWGWVRRWGAPTAASTPLAFPSCSAGSLFLLLSSINPPGWTANLKWTQQFALSTYLSLPQRVCQPSGQIPPQSIRTSFRHTQPCSAPRLPPLGLIFGLFEMISCFFPPLPHFQRCPCLIFPVWKTEAIRGPSLNFLPPHKDGYLHGPHLPSLSPVQWAICPIPLLTLAWHPVSLPSSSLSPSISPLYCSLQHTNILWHPPTWKTTFPGFWELQRHLSASSTAEHLQMLSLLSVSMSTPLQSTLLQLFPIWLSSPHLGSPMSPCEKIP